MLVGPDDGGVDHRIFIVGIIGQGFEKILPDAAFRPSRKPPVGVLPASETRWQIAPRRACPELVDHGLDKQLIAENAVAPDMARTARKKVLHPGKLISAQTITFHLNAFLKKASHESRFC
jgi:hypothetical protein